MGPIKKSCEFLCGEPHLMQQFKIRYFAVVQGWGTCDPGEHVIWPASDFPLSMSEHNIASKRSSMISKYLVSKSTKVTFPHN